MKAMGEGVCSQKLATRPSLMRAWRHVLGSAMPIHPSTRFSSGAPGAAMLEGGAQLGLIFHSSCQGELGIGLHSLKGKLDLI